MLDRPLLPAGTVFDCPLYLPSGASACKIHSLCKLTSHIQVCANHTCCESKDICVGVFDKGMFQTIAALNELLCTFNAAALQSRGPNVLGFLYFSAPATLIAACIEESILHFQSLQFLIFKATALTVWSHDRYQSSLPHNGSILLKRDRAPLITEFTYTSVSCG